MYPNGAICFGGDYFCNKKLTAPKKLRTKQAYDHKTTRND